MSDGPSPLALEIRARVMQRYGFKWRWITRGSKTKTVKENRRPKDHYQNAIKRGFIGCVERYHSDEQYRTRCDENEYTPELLAEWDIEAREKILDALTPQDAVTVPFADRVKRGWVRWVQRSEEAGGSESQRRPWEHSYATTNDWFWDERGQVWWQRYQNSEWWSSPTGQWKRWSRD
jgi:hypothetical protein